MHKKVERDPHEGRVVDYFKDLARETGRKYLREVSKLSRIIAQARSAEKALDRYRVLVESSSDVIFMLDREKKILSFNRAFCTFFQFDEDEIKGRTLRFVTGSSEEYERLSEVINNAVKEGGTHVFEWKFIKKDGSFIVMEVTISPIISSSADDDDNAPDGYVSILHDISDRIEREEALKSAEGKYRNIFENAAEGIFQVSSMGRYLSANPALARIFGFSSPVEMTGNEDYRAGNTFVRENDFKRFLNILDIQDSVENFEAERYRVDETRMWTSINARVVRDTQGFFLYYEGTVEDITHRKNLESQLRHAQKMEAVGTLAGGVAHDFNNILTALIGYGNLLQIKMEKDDPLRVYADQIISSAKRAANLTQGLLAFSRKQPINLEPHGMNEIVAGVHKLLERLLSEDIELRVNLAAEDIIVMADRTQIEQVLMNLVTNARDAMTDERAITVRIRSTVIDNSFIMEHGYGKPGNYAVLSVSDTGQGMDEHTREHIFEPFFTTKETGKGTGLGLSTVYGIVKQHDGYVTVESEPGEGSTFYIYLPVIKTKRERTVPEEHVIRRGTETILVAEDDRQIRELIEEVLKEYGYRAILAVDGEDAVRKYLEHKETIGLVIIDVIMPRKNGREVYAEISRIDPSVKALFISGHTRDIVFEKGVVDRDDNFLSKPVAPSVLMEKVRTLLDNNARSGP